MASSQKIRSRSTDIMRQFLKQGRSSAHLYKSGFEMVPIKLSPNSNKTTCRADYILIKYICHEMRKHAFSYLWKLKQGANSTKDKNISALSLFPHKISVHKYGCDCNWGQWPSPFVTMTPIPTPGRKNIIISKVFTFWLNVNQIANDLPNIS